MSHVTMKVPFFDMRTEVSGARSEIDAAIARVLDAGVFIGGEELTRFEEALAASAGARHAVGTSSGTDALHLLGMAAEIGPGDDVITTPFTFFATAGAFARLGARIVFADIDPSTFTLDPQAALAACTARTRAMVTVNLFGRLAELVPMPCHVFEDSAQSFGAAPPRGAASTLSFFPTKVLGALGDAGAVLTNDAELADRLRLLRTHGARPKFHHIAVGGNFRLDALQAAVLHAKLPRVPYAIRSRRDHAQRYRELLAALPLPPELQAPRDTPEHVYHQFVVRAPRRDQLRAYLASAGIATEIYYPEPLHLQPCFPGYRPGALPHAERACGEVLALPMYPALTATQQAYVVEQVARFYAR